jgi:hypothetical protein
MQNGTETNMKKYSLNISEAHEEKLVTLEIEISNLQPYQAQELKNLLYAMDLAGSLGSSRSFKVYVDGDGGFRPNVKIDGEDKKKFEFGKNVDFDGPDTLEFELD